MKNEKLKNKNDGVRPWAPAYTPNLGDGRPPRGRGAGHTAAGGADRRPFPPGRRAGVHARRTDDFLKFMIGAAGEIARPTE